MFKKLIIEHAFYYVFKYFFAAAREYHDNGDNEIIEFLELFLEPADARKLLDCILSMLYEDVCPYHKADLAAWSDDLPQFLLPSGKSYPENQGSSNEG